MYAKKEYTERLNTGTRPCHPPLPFYDLFPSYEDETPGRNSNISKSYELGIRMIYTLNFKTDIK